jgi:hypothetical protein
MAIEKTLARIFLLGHAIAISLTVLIIIACVILMLIFLGLMCGICYLLDDPFKYAAPYLNSQMILPLLGLFKLNLGN